MRDTILTVTGNVVDTPQRRKIESGHSVTTFRIASTARRFDKHEGHWTDGDSLYLKVTCWRALADNVDRSVVQGDPVIVTGRLYTRPYEVEGQRRSAYELEANAIGLDLSRGVATFSRTKSQSEPTFDVPSDADGAPGAARGAGDLGAGAAGGSASDLDDVVDDETAELAAI